MTVNTAPGLAARQPGLLAIGRKVHHDLRKRGAAADLKRINVHRLRDWTEKWHVYSEQSPDPASRVGPRNDDLSTTSGWKLALRRL
jgi:hypothetical protein